jgi:DNA-binding MarR family transcriptional regulator/GNAT superfamily N-acetyltransferase
MDEGQIATVRAFNRLVTHRVGALADSYLSSPLPLGEARVLWEIGREATDVRALRARLDLDSGYLSRVLRSLEGRGLVVVEPKPDDRRVRAVRLTARGRRLRGALDKRSDALASSILEPLSPQRRARLVAAMDEVRSLLTASLVEIDVVDPTDPAARFCLGEYFAELDRRFDIGFDPATSRPTDPDEMRAPDGLFLVATLHGEPIGCGALKFHGRQPGEIKRMWVAPSARGLGVGRRLLSELEQHAAEHGVTVVQLDTNRVLEEAIAMYRSSGYREIAAFNDEFYADHWFEKRL